jgi:hypothetical protein
MRPALDPAGHRVPRTKPTCLLHTWRPHRRRPFALVLHLHQHPSSRNLHLQYLAKNQSTQHCQSLITQGSDHPPVLEPHMVLKSFIWSSRLFTTPLGGIKVLSQGSSGYPGGEHPTCTGQHSHPRPGDGSLQSSRLARRPPQHSGMLRGLPPTQPPVLPRPHRTAQQPGGKNVPSRSTNLCGFLTETATKARGLLSGTSHKGPLITRKTPLLKNNKRKTNKPTNHKAHSAWSRSKIEKGPWPNKVIAAHQTASRGTPRVNLRLARGPGITPRSLRLARGLDAPSGESPPRSRA